MYTYNIIQTL